MTFTYLPYFLQNERWAIAWQEAEGKNHSYKKIKFQGSTSLIESVVYIYPWHFNQFFAYMPRGFTIKQTTRFDDKQLKHDLHLFMHEVLTYCKESSVVFLKIDLDDQLGDFLGIDSTEEMAEYLRLITKPNGVSGYIPTTIAKNSRPIQFMQTMTLDTGSLRYSNDINDFFKINTEFWSKTSQKIRRYTRKSLQFPWQLDTTKSEENFKHFWKVYHETSKRQQFGIHSKEYLSHIYKQDFARSIVIKDTHNQPHCVWLGISLDNTLTYLYGGNTQTSFDNHGQYIAHLAALQIAARERLSWYDLGGYDQEKGFGTFKEGYKGNIRKFLGPIDLVITQRKYDFTNKFVETAKHVQKLVHRR